jgi:hypothetical protein
MSKVLRGNHRNAAVTTAGWAAPSGAARITTYDEIDGRPTSRTAARASALKSAAIVNGSAAAQQARAGEPVTRAARRPRATGGCPYAVAGPDPA